VARRAYIALVAALLVTLNVAGIGSARAAAPGRAPLSPCWTSDHAAPVLDGATLSSNAVDVSESAQSVTVTVRAHDVGGPGPASGIASVSVVVIDEEDLGGGASTGSAHILPLQDAGLGVWSGAVSIPRDARFTQVQVFAVELTAVAGPDAAPSLSDAGVDGVIQVTSTHPDKTPPSLEWLGVSPSAVDVSHGAAATTVTARVSDTDTGVAAVHLWVLGAKRMPMRPTGTPGEFSAVVRIEPWVAHDLLFEVNMTDFAHNDAVVGTSELQSRGLPSRIAVSGGTPDHARPTARVLPGSDAVIDVRRHAASWHLRIAAADQGSGVAGVQVVDLGKGLPVPVGGSLQRSSGTRAKGVWSGDIRVSRCVRGPGPLHLAVRVTDRAGHTTELRETPHVRSRDNVAPRATALRGSNASTFTATFTEPVNGISTTTVRVLRRSFPVTPLIEGTWTCYSQLTGSRRTSCWDGSVRRARFVTSGPESPDEVQFTPPGHLDVRDLAGNPVLEHYFITIH
jgi:hypothetical protein